MKEYKRSSAYEKKFVEDNMMGPNSMCMLEDTVGHIELKPGMRVLDLGCGKGLTSVFLAREFGVTVYAVDLWISAAENYERFHQMGLDDKIIPLHAEAHKLPFADGYFDAAVSIDSYHYFGANDSYLPEHFARLVKKGGQLLVAAVGLTRDCDGIPESLRGVWKEGEDAFATFKSAG